jgi:alkylhydroperoxidase/carboxymuconolactone decarboxylase family protein YurZ
MPNARRPLTPPDQVRQRLAANRERRGYILPHQGLMAAAMPRLQDGYATMYAALTIDENHLSPFEREFVWLAVLTAAGEHVGTHHVKLFFELGGNRQQAEVVFRMVALATGAPRSFQFLAEHWERHFDPLEGISGYHAAADALIRGSGVTSELAHLALLAVHTTLAQRWGIEVELKAGYAAGVDEGKLAEACCLPMWATGINRTIDAAQVWLDLMRSGMITPSPSFQAWADTDQGALPI